MKYIIKAPSNTHTITGSVADAQDLAMDLQAREIERAHDGKTWTNQYLIAGNWVSSQDEEKKYYKRKSRG